MIYIKLKGESSIGLSNHQIDLCLDSGEIYDLMTSLNIHKEIQDQIMVIVNGKLARSKVLLKEGDEVLLHLPVTGG